MSEITWAYPVIIVQTAVRDICKQLVVYFAGESAAGMFDVPVYRKDDGTLYGYISTGAVDSGFMPTMTDPARLAQDAGIPLAEAQAILSQTHVGNQPWSSVLDEFELTLDGTD